MSEKSYILKRKIKAGFSKIPYIIFGCLPIRSNKIVFSAFEGAGYCCNPKYIAEELIKREHLYGEKYEMIWLVNDMTKEFPDEIIKKKIIFLIELIICQRRKYGLIMQEKIMGQEKEKISFTFLHGME